MQKEMVAIIRSWRPELLEEFGVGTIVAATVLCAWSHPGGIHSEAAFAMLAGVAPIPANSGQITTRYRLNRYGDRNLHNALHTVVQSRIQYQPATRDYVARRTTEGKTTREIKRCLARYVARDLYRQLKKAADTLLDEGHRSVARFSLCSPAGIIADMSDQFHQSWSSAGSSDCCPALITHGCGSRCASNEPR